MGTVFSSGRRDKLATGSGTCSAAGEGSVLTVATLGNVAFEIASKGKDSLFTPCDSVATHSRSFTIYDDVATLSFHKSVVKLWPWRRSLFNLNIIVTSCDWRVSRILRLFLDTRGGFLGRSRRLMLVGRRAIASITNLVERLPFHGNETVTRGDEMIETQNNGCVLITQTHKSQTQIQTFVNLLFMLSKRSNHSKYSA